MKTAETVQFRCREVCVSCGSSDLVPIWRGRFSDRIFVDHIPADFYNVDVPALLADEEFVRVRCGECDQSFHQNVLTDDWLSILYSSWIDGEQIRRFHDQAELRSLRAYERGRQQVKHVLRIQALVADDHCFPRLLDFGCGQGDFLQAARVLGVECFGVDFGAVHGAVAETSTPRIFASLQALDACEDAPFDAVTLFQVLEHLAEPREVLEQLGDRLRPDGILVVEVPDCSGIDVPRGVEQFHNVDPLEHLNHFTPDTLANLCRRVGFERVKRIPAHVTTRLSDVVRSEASRFHQPSKTSMYFRWKG